MSSLDMNVATKKRLGSYSGGKATYASVAGNIFGNFQAFGPSEETQGLGIIGQAYAFYVSGETDIVPGDILTINSTDYTVKGVKRQSNGSVDTLECLLALTVAD